VYAEAMAGCCHDRSSGSRIATPHVADVCIFRQLLLELSDQSGVRRKGEAAEHLEIVPKTAAQ
jgi:hypothetical protein